MTVKKYAIFIILYNKIIIKIMIPESLDADVLMQIYLNVRDPDFCKSIATTIDQTEICTGN
jgi:hypothetical protein